MLASVLVAVISWSVVRYAASSPSVSHCNPANHICEGRCPKVPQGAQLPSTDSATGLCLQDSLSDACVCWLRNPTEDKHLQTLFKCDVVANRTVKHVMCLPPPFCFPPGPDPGCLIVPNCPCVRHLWGAQYGTWSPVVAVILRSNTPVAPVLIVTPVEAPAGVTEAAPVPTSDSREFSIKHLLFLLAFVIAPLICWCLLTFFHEGKCRKKRRSPETEPMSPPLPCEPDPEDPPQMGSLLPPQQPQPPTAPKFESPPPYREAVDPSESCLLAADCGPPPSYEDAVRGQWHISIHRTQEPDSD